MANCVKCGAPLREGAKFCGACGAKIELQRFCTQCGEPLEPGEKFCTQCGAPVEGAPAPAPKRRGRPPKNPAAVAAPAAPKANKEKKPDFPDVRGFYGKKDKAVSASDEALVWGEGGKVYCLDRNWNIRLKEMDSVGSIIQTKENILVLDRTYDSDCVDHLVLKTFDKQLSLLSEKEFDSWPDDCVEGHEYYMTQFDLFILQHTEADDVDLSDPIDTDISLRQIDLSTGETKEWSWDRLEWKGWTVSFDGGAFLGVDGGRPYLFVSLQKEDDRASAILIFDPQTGGFSLLWQGGYVSDEGRPMFFDWKKRIMWTRPTKAEIESRSNLTKKSLVARKIAPNAPILSAMPTWQEFPDGYGSFSYFDGEHAYYAPRYYEFYGFDKFSGQSEDWNRSGHGRTETAVVWPQTDKIVMDLMADYYYTVYPMSVAKPDYGELITPKKIDWPL